MQSLNARIESQENWTPAQNERLDKVKGEGVGIEKNSLYISQRARAACCFIPSCVRSFTEVYVLGSILQRANDSQ